MDRIQIAFPNGNSAWAVICPNNDAYGDILQALGIPPTKNLLIVIGGAKNLDESNKANLYALFSNGIAALAAEIGALIIDGGTKSGVMEMMGQGVAEYERQSVLLGVAPEGKVDYQSQPTIGSGNGRTHLDPNHSHFVLVKGSKWGDETATLFGLATELAQRAHVVTVLAGGGEVAKQEVLQSVQQGWPIIVISGSGDLTDDIARLWRQKRSRPPFLLSFFRRNQTSPEKDIAKIVEDGDIYLFSHKASSDELKALLEFLFLRQEKGVLAQIKESEEFYAHLAGEHQKVFRRLQRWILGLGVLATALALGQTQLVEWGWLTTGTMSIGVFHFFVVLVPIVITALLGITTFFKWGDKWVMLRTTREAVKQEIFRYRTHTGIYEKRAAAGNHPNARLTAEQKFVERVKVITQRLMQAEGSLTAFPSHITPRLPKLSGADEDNGFSDLTPNRYIKFRLDDQRVWYRRKAAELDRKLKIYQSLIIIASAFGALLAAIGVELWLPLAIAVGAAFGLYLEYMQVVNTMTQYNQAAANLEDVKHWWTALPESERIQPESFNKLVEATEKILESEHQSWVKNMLNALDQLYKKNSTNNSNGSNEVE